MLCTSFNQWIKYIKRWIHFEPNDPSGQLKWLVGVLTQAEADGEIVHILSHIPAGITDCFSTYTREYRRIIERYFIMYPLWKCEHLLSSLSYCAVVAWIIIDCILPLPWTHQRWCFKQCEEQQGEWIVSQ